MKIQKKGGMSFNIKGSKIESFSDYSSQVKKCLIPLQDFNVDYREILQKEVVTKGQILINTPNDIFLAPISGSLDLKKNDVLEIVANGDHKVSSESLDLLKDGVGYKLLSKLGLIKKIDFTKLKSLVVQLTHTEPFLVKDKILFKLFGPKLKSALLTISEIFPDVTKSVLLSQPNYDNLIPDGWDKIEIKDFYPYDNEKFIQSNLEEKRPSDINTDEVLFIGIEKLIAIHNYLKEETPPTYQYLSVSGNIETSKLIQVPLYSDLEELIKEFLSDGKNFYDYDVIIGGVFNGRSMIVDPIIHSFDSSITMLENNRPRKLWSFMQPGFNEQSYSKTFLSSYLPFAKTIDCQIHGEKRACVFCGFCQEVCPVKIIPFVLFKHIKIDALEDAKKYRIMDCIDCGLCTHVCPSKIEIANIISSGKQAIVKENI